MWSTSPSEWLPEHSMVSHKYEWWNQILNRKQRCFMGEGGVRRDALCNAASDQWIGRCLLTSFQDFLYNNPPPPSILFSCPFFFTFFSFILNGLDQDLTIHFWFQLPKLNLPAPPLLTITLENRDVWQVSQFHEVEAVSKQRRKSLCDGSVAQRLHWNLLVFTAWIWHERGLAWYPSSMVIVLLLVSNNYHEPFPPFDFCGNCSIPR